MGPFVVKANLSKVSSQLVLVNVLLRKSLGPWQRDKAPATRAWVRAARSMDGSRAPPRALPPMPSTYQEDEVPMGRPKKKKSKQLNSALEDVAQETVSKSSESKEPLTPERRKRKKKKFVEAETAFTNQNLNASITQNGNDVDSQPSDEVIVRKPRRRAKKTRPAEHGFPNDLGVEEEDIIPDGQIKLAEQHPAVIVSSLISQPVGKLFVEKNRKFQAADRSGIIRTTEHVDDFLDIKPTWGSMDVSLSVHRSFRMIGLFCSGFLSGYTVWNIVVIYVLSGSQLTSLPLLLEIYKGLAYPSQCFLYFLLAVSTVSAFDRIDLASVSNAVRGLVTLDPSALASFLYFVALFLALSQQMTSDRINFYTPPTQNGSLWQEGTERQILQPWVVVNLVVTLLVGLAWLFLSCRPDLDHSEESIFIPEEEECPDMEKGVKIQA
ncbi:LOW QUALITY PROTEIN: transmembrane protein 237 [Dendrobates tinctorius]|uniref:LOW QUALITY PROTEIN: transmembrane protein 237 n=1 Tax=Dendrobates tinctorius TaxID=92724 RepID=UPI003CCA4D69